MNGKKRLLTLNEWTSLVLYTAVFLGLIVRFLPGIMAGFPLNDGGMFFTMARDLRNAGFILPRFTSYNHSGVPFAYPPLGFYFLGFLSSIFAIDNLTLLRWLPPLISSLSILGFYKLAVELLKSKPLGALASVLYSLTPGAPAWFIMGGGLTRSFGALFLLLLINSSILLFKRREGRYLWLVILFGAATVASHPEAAVHAAAVCFLVWLFWGRTIDSFINVVKAGLGVLLATLPWWGTIISYHGMTPFLSALNTGSYGTPFWKAFGVLIIGSEVAPLLAALRLLGLAWGVWRKEYFLLAWVVVPYLVEPRSAPSNSFYPMCMLVALAIAQFLPFARSAFRKIDDLRELPYQNKLYNTALFLLIILIFVDSSLFGFRLVGNSLKEGDIKAMRWVYKNTPSSADFLVYTGITAPEIDPFVEWFPALADRHSLTTIQGLEWSLGEGFFSRYSELSRLQACGDLGCILEWTNNTHAQYDYVVVREKSVGVGVAASFRESRHFRLVYSEDGVAIFRHAR